MTDPKPQSAARTSSVSSVTWSRCSATGTVAASASAAVARAIGASRLPWNRTAFSLIWQMTGRPAASAPVTTASACSRVITLNAPTARPSRYAEPTTSAV